MKKLGIKAKIRIRNSLCWCAVVITFVFIVPICINWAYTKPALIPSLAMNWEASDVLAFYGSLLGAVATIIALIKTIEFTREHQREEHKRSIRPYLETNIRKCEKITDIPPEGSNFIHVTEKRVCCNTLPPESEILRAIKQEQAHKNLNLGEIIMYAKEGHMYLNKNHFFIYKITNYGAGNALNTAVKINGQVNTPSFCIAANESKELVFVLSNDIFEHMDEPPYALNLLIQFSDVASLAKYAQTEDLFFSRDDNDKSVQWSGGIKRPPIEIKNKTW